MVALCTRKLLKGLLLAVFSQTFFSSQLFYIFCLCLTWGVDNHYFKWISCVFSNNLSMNISLTWNWIKELRTKKIVNYILSNTTEWIIKFIQGVPQKLVDIHNRQEKFFKKPLFNCSKRGLLLSYPCKQFSPPPPAKSLYQKNKKCSFSILPFTPTNIALLYPNPYFIWWIGDIYEYTEQVLKKCLKEVLIKTQLLYKHFIHSSLK